MTLPKKKISVSIILRIWEIKTIVSTLYIFVLTSRTTKLGLLIQECKEWKLDLDQLSLLCSMSLLALSNFVWGHP